MYPSCNERLHTWFVRVVENSVVTWTTRSATGLLKFQNLLYLVRLVLDRARNKGRHARGEFQAWWRRSVSALYREIDQLPKNNICTWCAPLLGQFVHLEQLSKASEDYFEHFEHQKARSHTARCIPCWYRTYIHFSSVSVSNPGDAHFTVHLMA